MLSAARIVAISNYYSGRCALLNEEGEYLVIDFDDGAPPMSSTVSGHLDLEGSGTFVLSVTGEMVTGCIEATGAGRSVALTLLIGPRL